MVITKTTSHPFRSLWEITEAAHEAGHVYFDFVGSYNDYTSRSGAHAAAKREQARRS